MRRSAFTATLAGFGLGLVLLQGITLVGGEPDNEPSGIFDQKAIPQEDNLPEQEGVEAQAKGVVHEAFASPAVFTAQATEPIAKQPPQAIEEMPPEQKPDGDNVQWINGYFAHESQKNDFYWVSGIWRNIPPNMEWVPGTWNQTPQGWSYYSGFWKQSSAGELDVVPMPPEPLQTVDPPAPDADSTYIPGSWVYGNQQRYVWRPACWVPQRPGWVWVAARYVRTHCGWVYIAGYYDYVLQERGLLYSPVYVNTAYYNRPGFIYRPRYVVHDQCLLSCMFVNRNTGCYHFGNYYDDHYRNSGYVSWASYRVNRHPEPLFSHYRYVNRRDPRWEINLVSLQRDRYKGIVERPPVTIIQQRNVIKNNTQINNLVLIAPATKINTKVVTMRKLDATEMNKQVTASKTLRDAGNTRAANESRIAKTFGEVKIGDAPKSLVLNLPKTTQTTVVTNRIKNLPPPPTGQRDQRGNAVITGTKTNPKVTTDPMGKTIDTTNTKKTVVPNVDDPTKKTVVPNVVDPKKKTTNPNVVDPTKKTVIPNVVDPKKKITDPNVVDPTKKGTTTPPKKTTNPKVVDTTDNDNPPKKGTTTIPKVIDTNPKKVTPPKTSDLSGDTGTTVRKPKTTDSGTSTTPKKTTTPPKTDDSTTTPKIKKGATLMPAQPRVAEPTSLVADVSSSRRIDALRKL